jgi:1-acyl-sn-glycerol-3-phosphate acyltransferase
VFVDRRRHESAVDTIETAARNLRPGSPLLVFPEGTRGFRSEVQRFKTGAFHLAKQAQVAIVPVGIRGGRRVWPRERRAPLPGRIEVHYGVPIPPDDVAATPLDALIARARSEVASLADLPIVDVPDRGAAQERAS